MPAISFNREFLDALLSGTKQQTTRKQTDRIKVGDVCHIYIEQRNRITEKPLRRLTQAGLVSRLNWANKENVYYPNHDYAHFLGKAEITEVYDITPRCMDGENSWARADGFSNIEAANDWFTERYGNGWVDMHWTVIKWGGWIERYFKPDGDLNGM